MPTRSRTARSVERPATKIRARDTSIGSITDRKPSTVLGETKKMLDTLVALRNAPIDEEEYRGPVLFSQWRIGRDERRTAGVCGNREHVA